MSRIRINLKTKWDGSIDPNAGFLFALVYMISEIKLIPIKKWPLIPLDECLEARLFGEKGELHLFREEDTLFSTSVEDLPDAPDCNEQGKEDIDLPDTFPANICIKDCAFIDRMYKIRTNCLKEVPGFSGIVIREYIGYDGDGQAYTMQTRPAGLV